jgi:hypothetical protein
VTRPICKPLGSKHHAELQAIGDRAAARFADLASIDAALRATPSRDDLADLAFAWARLVMALGGWGWWSVSADGRLNPALVSWNKAWFVVPIDCVLEGRAVALFERLRALPTGAAGSLQEVVVETA